MVWYNERNVQSSDTCGSAFRIRNEVECFYADDSIDVNNYPTLIYVIAVKSHAVRTVESALRDKSLFSHVNISKKSNHALIKLRRTNVPNVSKRLGSVLRAHRRTMIGRLLRFGSKWGRYYMTNICTYFPPEYLT